MAFDDDRLDRVFKKTRGICHGCRKQLTRSNYGQPNRRGSWEVDHSVPKAQGGTDHLNNLYPICTDCNREKGDSHARTLRSKHGYSRPPLSPKEYQKKKRDHAAGGGILGATIGWGTGGPLGALICGAIGAGIGASSDPEAE